MESGIFPEVGFGLKTFGGEGEAGFLLLLCTVILNSGFALWLRSVIAPVAELLFIDVKKVQIKIKKR